jgi:5-methylcytosine-specific restriction endonuclease McrA
MPTKDPAKKRAHAKTFREKNPGKARAWVRKWRAEHPDFNGYAREQNRANYAKDPVGIQAKKRDARKRRIDRDPERERNVDNNRNYRRRICEGTVTVEEWLHVLRLYGSKCLCCKADEITRDHVIPLSKGGLNVASNLQPLCGCCNKKKATRTVDYRPYPYWAPEDW